MKICSYTKRKRNNSGDQRGEEKNLMNDIRKRLWEKKEVGEKDRDHYVLTGFQLHKASFHL